ncbi:MAG: DUF882 domain-containing protein [Magnetococcales bacterium]|nr:DUF882 domain-containing protein [Magnetococcales bacterium]
MTIINEWKWPHFKKAEMQCQCGCGKAAMDPEFMDRLHRLRLNYGKPIHVSSGYRCPSHNNAVSHTGDGGPHTTGRAVDIRISGAEAVDLLRKAVYLGFTGIGVSQQGAHESRFLHLDDLGAPSWPRPGIWSY